MFFIHPLLILYFVGGSHLVLAVFCFLICQLSSSIFWIHDIFSCTLATMITLNCITNCNFSHPQTIILDKQLDTGTFTGFWLIHPLATTHWVSQHLRGRTGNNQVYLSIPFRKEMAITKRQFFSIITDKSCFLSFTTVWLVAIVFND